jgi:ABC-type cobalt transport system substrate-binding protein
MKKKFARLAIVAIVLAQLVWFIFPRHGSQMGDAYRNRERLEALKQYSDSPSATTKAAVDKEMDLLSSHMAKRRIQIFAIMVAVDVVLIFAFWNWGSERRAGTDEVGNRTGQV